MTKIEIESYKNDIKDQEKRITDMLKYIKLTTYNLHTDMSK
jgi:hypothetical protein